LGNYFEKFKIAHIFGLLFTLERLSINFGKKCLGLLFGQFFTNSSGHPVSNVPIISNYAQLSNPFVIFTIFKLCSTAERMPTLVFTMEELMVTF
jgi:hypothetical protein